MKRAGLWAAASLFLAVSAKQSKCRSRPHGPTSLADSTGSSASAGLTSSQISSLATSSLAQPWTTTSTPKTATSATSAATKTNASAMQKGLGWAMQRDALGAPLLQGSSSWYYHWENPPVGIAKNIEYVPMLWGTSKLQQFQDVMKTYSDSNLPKAILAFNEPDIFFEAAMYAKDAADIWIKHLEPYAKKGVRLGAPAMAYSPDWLEDFFGNCTACTIDFLQVHWYGATDMNEFKAWFPKWEAFLPKVKSRKIWVTEWGIKTATNPVAANVLTFLQQSTEWLASLDYVERAAFFGVWERNPDGVKTPWVSDLCAFLTPAGQLTDLGKYWIS